MLACLLNRPSLTPSILFYSWNITENLLLWMIHEWRVFLPSPNWISLLVLPQLQELPGFFPENLIPKPALIKRSFHLLIEHKLLMHIPMQKSTKNQLAVEANEVTRMSLSSTCLFLHILAKRNFFLVFSPCIEYKSCTNCLLHFGWSPVVLPIVCCRLLVQHGTTDSSITSKQKWMESVLVQTSHICNFLWSI